MQLPLLGEMRLVGGTALALQYGHRRSVDLDFFGNTTEDIDELTEALHDSVECVVRGNCSKRIKSYMLNGVKVDIVNYDYPWIGDFVDEEGLRLASPQDIAAMKVNAVMGRGTKKDFIDVYFLLRHFSFAELINHEKGKTGAKEIVVVSMIILVIGFGVMYLAGYVCYGVIPYNAPMMIAPIPKLLAIVNFILLPVTTAFAEDGLYLGYGVNRIQNKYAAILVPAFFFALQHSFIPTLFDIKYMIYRFTSFLPLTIILCGYYYKKRNPLPVMIGHAIIDIATVSWILMTSLIPGFYDNLSAMSK